MWQTRRNRKLTRHGAWRCGHGLSTGRSGGSRASADAAGERIDRPDLSTAGDDRGHE
jgi:hypothetical protein